MWFANVVELYQKRNHNCFMHGNRDHLVKDCQKEMGETARKVRWAVLDTGSTINAVTTEFIKAHSLDVDPLHDLVDITLKMNGFGWIVSPTLGLCHC